MRCGIAISEQRFYIATFCDTGNLIYRQSADLDLDYNAFIVMLRDEIAPYYQDISWPIGISIEGHFNPQNGLVDTPSIPLIDKTKLKTDLQAALSHEILIAGHGQTLGKAATYNTEYKNCPSLFSLYLGDTALAGMVFDRKLITSLHGLSPNWAHICLPWPIEHELDGWQCGCGRKGCLGQYTSPAGLMRDYEMLSGESETANVIIDKALHGDIIAESALQAFEDRLARGLGLIINLFDPHIIVLGGKLACYDRLYVNIPRKWPGYVNAKLATRLTYLGQYDDSLLPCLKGAAFLS